MTTKTRDVFVLGMAAGMLVAAITRWALTWWLT